MTAGFIQPFGSQKHPATECSSNRIPCNYLVYGKMPLPATPPARYRAGKGGEKEAKIFGVEFPCRFVMAVSRACEQGEGGGGIHFLVNTPGPLAVKGTLIRPQASLHVSMVPHRVVLNCAGHHWAMFIMRRSKPDFREAANHPQRFLPRRHPERSEGSAVTCCF